MPKKFQGVNTKSAEARARKAEKHQQEQETKQREAEDAYWKDDDKTVARKQQRKEQQEQKRLNQLNKKKELDELYKADQESVAKTVKTPSTSKVTRAQLDSLKQAEQADKAAQDSTAQLQKKNITVQQEDMEINVNKVISQSLQDGSSVEARSIEEAISVLGVDEELDRHPERRLKASFKKFEQEYLPQLKAENPNMRMSQLRQALRKAWQKSPENPLNQKHSAYNTK